MKNKFKHYYMDIAKRTAELSYCKRLKVGAIVVKDDRVLSIGYNGTPAGQDNCCEKIVLLEDSPEKAQWLDPIDIEEEYPFTNEHGQRYKTITKFNVLHAEENAIGKLAKANESGLGAIMFLTHAPCIHCAKTIYASGIDTVYYNSPYRSTNGIEFLQSVGVHVTHLK